jgi:long-chain fatty acid transport protein
MRVVLTLIVLVVPSPARAQRENYEAVLVGERAAGMGGAFTGLADDASAAYYNPAGLAQIRRRGFSLSASGYSYYSRTASGVISAEDESVDLEQAGVLVYPNETSYVLPLGEGDDWAHTVALSLFVPYGFDWEGVQDLSLDGSFQLLTNLFAASDEQVYLVGPSYAARFGPVHLGLSVFVLHVHADLTRSVTLTFNEDAALATYRSSSFEYTSGSFFGLTGTAGALWVPNDYFALGLRVRLPALRIGGSAETFYTESSSFVADDPTTMAPSVLELHQDVYANIEGDVQYRVPVSFSLGFSAGIPDRFRISADVRLYLPLDAYELVDGGVVQATPMQRELPGGTVREIDTLIRDPGRRLVVNGAIGFDVRFLDEFFLLGGLFNDMSAVPDEGLADLGQVDLWGASLAVSRRTDSTTFTLGVTGKFGFGETSGLRFERTAEGPAVVDATSELFQWSLTLFIAGSTVLGDDPDAEPSESPLTEPPPERAP